MKKSRSRRVLAAPPPARSRKALWIAASAVLTVGLAIRFWPTATMPPAPTASASPADPPASRASMASARADFEPTVENSAPAPGERWR